MNKLRQGYINPPTRCKVCNRDTLAKQNTRRDNNNFITGFEMTCLNKECSTSGLLVIYGK